MSKPSPIGIHSAIQSLLALALVVLILNVGRPVLLPFAMAALGAFLLTPIIKALERRGLPRIVAVITTALGSLGVVVAASWLVASQLNELAGRLPLYRENLVNKLSGLSFNGGVIDDLNHLYHDVTATLTEPQSSAPEVRVVEAGEGPFSRLQTLVRLVVEPISSIGVVLVLMIFVLIYREDLRNRIVRLSGQRFALTTRTLDDLAVRISRYLMANVIVNSGYGAVVALGLYFIGIEYAVMWGALAGVLRFLPYIGPAIGMLLPMTMAFIQFPGPDWTHLFYTAAFFAVVETTMNVVIEPLIYGYSIGVSIVALLASAVFWSWLWGPMGLLLSAPITVTLAVLGEYVGSLESLGILLSDKPALDNHVIFYQRLLAGDVDEAEEVLESEIETSGLLEAYDAVAIPAVIMAERDLRAGELSTSEYDAIVQSARDYLEEVPPVDAPIREDVQNGEAVQFRTRVIAYPVHDAGDEMVLEALRGRLVEGPDGELKVVPPGMLASEILLLLQTEQPDAVCLSSLGPGGRRQLRYLCKRIRHGLPQIRIVVGNWGYRRNDVVKMTASLKQCGADVVLTTLGAAREFFESLAPRPAITRPTSGSESVEVLAAMNRK